ncbi:TetR/AcrR family transcriptional regulator [Dactylosporangium cerinum]|uniref:TetR/AcrR family transcriptional regulator n=1 Tax=Dactylosporangium cerinum TaxID=1434730 RepID=A0ABV9W2C1_9ACTN
MTSRAEQRRQTEARILDAARRIFAERGYDRTTIRAVAAAADTDPGLVMRHYGSKDNLYAHAVRSPGEPASDLPPVTPDTLPDHLLATLHDKLAHEPVELLAQVRSMFTHPESAQDVRSTITAQQRAAATVITTDNPQLRASLVGALILGTIIGRYVLRLDELDAADPDTITEHLRPAIAAILGTPEAEV